MQKKMQSKVKIAAALIPFGLVFIADLATKYLLISTFGRSFKPIHINDFLNIVGLWNKGISFSLFADSTDFTRYILTFITVIIVAVIVFWIKKETSRFTVTALGFILGGALGNLVDRFYNKAVFDFLDFHIGTYHWPAFNIADSAIVFGAVMLIISCFVKGIQEKDN